MSAITNPRELDRYISGIAAGDKVAMARLYEATRTAVHSYALSILKDRHQAEDILHDCYIAAWGAAANYRPDGRALNWLMTITRNLCLRQLNENRRRDQAPPEDWSTLIPAGDDPAQTAEDRLMLSRCMSLLADDERQILVLHAVNGFKHREIAHTLGMPLATVLSKYSRTLRKLKQSMKGDETA